MKYATTLDYKHEYTFIHIGEDSEGSKIYKWSKWNVFNGSLVDTGEVTANSPKEAFERLTAIY